MVAEGWNDDEILDAWCRLLHNFTKRGETEVLAAAAYLRGQPTSEPEPARGWRDVEDWTEADFERHVEIDRRQGGTGGYRSVAKRTEGWLPTALLRRWQGERPQALAVRRAKSHHPHHPLSTPTQENAPPAPLPGAPPSRRRWRCNGHHSAARTLGQGRGSNRSLPP